MQLAYGNYFWAANSVAVSSRTTVVKTRAGIPYLQSVQYHVAGDLLAVGQAACSLAETLLRAALSKNYQNLVLLNDDLSNSSAALINAQTLSGVMIVDGPHFPLKHGPGPEFVTMRSFEFTAQADYAIAGTQNLFTEFTESLAFSGGTPYYAMKRAVNGPPQRQLIWPQTEYVCVQSGSAKGFRRQPNPPAQKFPGYLKGDPQVQLITPERTGINYKNWGITWNFRFESPAPLVAVPTLWPLNM